MNPPATQPISAAGLAAMRTDYHQLMSVERQADPDSFEYHTPHVRLP